MGAVTLVSEYGTYNIKLVLSISEEYKVSSVCWSSIQKKNVPRSLLLLMTPRYVRGVLKQASGS
ncbi:unnamed protein product [Timema podura]|uniref:Uncharacterized protein n=1 Tax=Timema podura TaxID=61482 RepID=A0ABN7PGJ4_TIMPD|nr:unnamed protein product [Timema podura]